MGGTDTPPGIDVAEMRAKLLAAREDMLRARDQSAEARKPVQLDQTSVGRLSRMDAIQGQAMALAAEQNRAATLTRIEAALARIADGSYGWCLGCGEPIAPKRLALDPSLPTCIACAGGRR